MKHKEVSGVFVKVKEKILLVRRHKDLYDGNTWALPSGKIEQKETPIQTIIREIKEEIGLKVSSSQCVFLGSYTWKFSEFTIKYHTFEIEFHTIPDIVLHKDELTEYVFETPEEVYQRKDLIKGLHDLLEYVGYVRK